MKWIVPQRWTAKELTNDERKELSRLKQRYIRAKNDGKPFEAFEADYNKRKDEIEYWSRSNLRLWMSEEMGENPARADRR